MNVSRSSYRNRAQALEAAYRLAAARAKLRNTEASADVVPTTRGRWLAGEVLPNDGAKYATVIVYPWAVK